MRAKKIYHETDLNGYTRIFVVFGITIFALCSVAIFSWKSARTTESSGLWVAHTGQVLSDLTVFLSAFAEADNAARSFTMNGRESDLASLAEKREAAWRAIEKLKQDTADNRQHQANLELLADDVQVRFNVLDELIEVRKERGFSAAMEWSRDHGIIMYLVRVPRAANVIAIEESGLLSGRAASAISSARTLLYTTALTILIAFFAIAACLYLVIRTLRRQAVAAKRYREAYEKLKQETDTRGLVPGFDDFHKAFERAESYLTEHR